MDGILPFFLAPNIPSPPVHNKNCLHYLVTTMAWEKVPVCHIQVLTAQRTLLLVFFVTLRGHLLVRRLELPPPCLVLLLVH